jgi:hypothetical protein
MKTSPHPDFIDYWERGTLGCIGVRVWENYCQAISCEPRGNAETMVLVELSYALPFTNLQGRSPVPLIVFAIATHMMMHPESDLLEVLGRTKSLAEARLSASPDYGEEPPAPDSPCVH